jgi:hypothetical protein
MDSPNDGRARASAGVARTSPAFAVRLAVAMAGRPLGVPLLVGTGSPVFFVAYVCSAGMTAEFAAVWGTAE